MMTAVLGTLPFIGVLWLLVVLSAAVLEESGAKISAALKGVPLQQRPTAIERRVSKRTRSQVSTAAIVRLRAAA